MKKKLVENKNLLISFLLFIIAWLSIGLSFGRLNLSLNLLILLILLVIGFSIGYFAKRNSKLSSKMTKMIFYDGLTNLPNRRLLEQDFAKLKNDKSDFALIFADLDNFKNLNDTYGHDHGDVILIEVSRLFVDFFNDTDTVYRWGGDEFVFVLRGYSRDQLDSACKKLIQLFETPFGYENINFSLGISMGVVEKGQDYDELIQLVKLADTTMYNVKAKGKNDFKYLRKEIAEYVDDEVKYDLLTRTISLPENSVVYYQPRISFDTNLITGIEALIRIFDEEGNMILPQRFIKAAEKNGVIRSIDKFVIETVAKTQIKLAEEGIFIPISINISGLSFNSELVKIFRHLKEIINIKPELLEIEITESVSISNIDETLLILNSLSDMGYRILLDDFGTEYSSLSYLANLPVDLIKIDRMFVMEDNESNKKVINAIVSLGNSMELDVIAEGIETKEQYDLLKSMGCNCYQGFLFSRGIEINELIQLVKNHQGEK